MAVNLSPVGGVAAQFFDNSGNVLTGGLLYTYAAGTTTPAITYTTFAGVTPHSNPIVLNAAGRVPDSGEIWLTDGISYKFVLKDSNDVQIATYDNITGINSNFINYSLQAQVITATQGQTVFNLTSVTYQPATNSLAVFVNGSRQVITLNYTETDADTVTFVDGLNVGDVVEFITATSATGNATTAANVSYNQGDTGAVTRTVEAKLQETISVLDFGADPTGVTDSTTAINNAISAAAEKALVFDGIFLINSTINIYDPIKIQFLGGAGVLGPSSYLKKSATCTGDAITINPSAIGTIIEGGGVVGDVGNTGNGIRIAATSVTLRNVVVNNCGGSGFRIGPDTSLPSTDNFNSFLLDGCSAYNNGLHGLYIHDPSIAGNANAGVVNKFASLGNGGDGIRIENAYWNTIVGGNQEDNTGYGVNILAAAAFNTFVGGDVEGNTAGEILDNSTSTSFLGISAVTNISSLPQLRVTNILNCLAQIDNRGQLRNYVGSTSAPSTANASQWFIGGNTGLNYAGTIYSGSVSTDVFFGAMPTSVGGADTIGIVTVVGGVATPRVLFNAAGITLPQISSSPITAGAADSGGTGFRLLRVPN
jgi:hypothetical protein